MKQQITGKLLVSAYRRSNKSITAIYIFMAAAAVICAFIIPFPIGPIAATVVIIAGILLYLRLRSSGSAGDPGKAYLALRELTDKKEYVSRDGESGDSYSYALFFGEDSLETDYKTYKATEPGHSYYVACFDKNGKPFACFDADEYEPGSDVTIKQ